MNRDRLLAMLTVALCFCVGYGLLAVIPKYSSIPAYTPIDHVIPLIPYFIIFYLMGDVYLFTPFFFIEKKDALWRLAKFLCILMAVAFVCFALIPLEIDRPQIASADIFSTLTKLYYEHDTTSNLFPSLHVSFSVFAWLVLLKVKRKAALYTAPIAWGIVASVLLVKTHFFVDVIAGIVLAYVVYWYWATPQPQREPHTRN